MTQNMTLSSRQRKAIQALLVCRSVSEAADQAGLTRNTVHKYLNDAGFAAALQAAEAEAVSLAARKIATAAGEAVDLLRKVLSDPAASNSEKIAAARAILQYLVPVRLLGSVEDRIKKYLERKSQNGNLRPGQPLTRRTRVNGR